MDRKKLTAALLCAALMSGTMNALAKDFITVDQWAYNDVSNFNSEKLLPADMEEITDYRQSITRVQFAELIYSVLLKTQNITANGYEYFADTDNEAANAMGIYCFMEGDVVDVDQYGNEIQNFYPELSLTREDAAVITYRLWTLLLGETLSGETVQPSDASEISDYAVEAVGRLMADGILSGTVNGRFEPKGSFTVEQAITIVYRLYRSLPTAPYADGQNIHSSVETEVQTYENGVKETKKNDMLYLKVGEKTLLQFETDVYTNIKSATVDGVIYAVAQNVNNKTDVYNADSGEIVFKIPYPVYLADSSYIVTKSSNLGPFTFGLYDYSGNEVLEPKYSLEEVEQRKAEHSDIRYEYRAADGWIYYADWSDYGHLYKIDSNGENKQKLSDYDCFNIYYVNGWLYYSVRGEDEDKLFVMRADGKYEQRVTDNKTVMINPNYTLMFPSDGWVREVASYSLTSMDIDARSRALYDEDGWVYYIEEHPDKTNLGTIRRIRVSENGIEQETISGICDGEVLLAGNEVQYMNNRVYFVSYSQEFDLNTVNTFRKLYCFDGESTFEIGGMEGISSYGFYNDSLVFLHINEDESWTWYIMDTDGGNLREWIMTDEDRVNGEKAYNELENYESEVIEKTVDGGFIFDHIPYKYCDENYTVHWISASGDLSANGDRAGLWVKDSEGNEVKMCDSWTGGFQRLDDMLYYPCSDTDNGRVSRSIWQYDMNTQEQKKVITGVRSISTVSGDGWFLYTDCNFNIWIYHVRTGEAEEVFPNSGENRYGKVERIVANNGLCKIDVNGNYVRLDSGNARYWSYVENGEATGRNYWD